MMNRLTILGVGNILMRDDGIGPCLVEAIAATQAWPADVEFIDGGVGGLALVDIIEQAGRLVVFDAADMSLPCGEYRIISPSQLGPAQPADSAGLLSLHDMPFIQTLQLCEKFTRRPGEVTIFAVQPGDIKHGRHLSQPLQDKFAELVAAGRGLVQHCLK
jgi:hydrogenase maturation protease